MSPLSLQDSQQWSSNGFNPFGMDLISTANYFNLSFESQQLSLPKLNFQVLMSCISHRPYLDSKNDYNNFNQFLNSNPTI